jgi:uncharacterized protein YjbI with pentapeptide repeats
VVTWSQEKVTQITGTVIDINSNKGIEGVAVQLEGTTNLQFTDTEGKFKFNNPKGFIVGDAHSFILSKEGYELIGSASGKVISRSGAISKFGLKREINNYLWITLRDGLNGDFIANATVDIQGNSKTSNDLGKVFFDFSNFEKTNLTVSIKADCYKNNTFQVSSKGEEFIELIPTCRGETTTVSNSDMNLDRALLLLDRALKSRNGSNQGQVEAIEYLHKNGHDFISTNFDGVQLQGLKLLSADMSSSSFDFSDLSNASLEECIINKSNIRITDLENLRFTSGELTNSNIIFANGAKADFSHTNLQGSYFFGCDFRGANFSDTNLKDTMFIFCDFTGAIFNDSSLLNTGLSGCILDETSFDGATINNTDITASVAKNQQFNFSETQKEGLCMYKNRYEGRGLTSLYFGSSFTLVQVNPETKYGSKYDDVIRKDWGVTNLNTGSCALCNSEQWSKNKRRETRWEYRLYATQSILSNNDRLAYTRAILKRHEEAFIPRLLIGDTYASKEIYEEWNKKIKDHFTSALPTIPELNKETLRILLLKEGLLEESQVNWERAADTYIKELINTIIEESPWAQNRGQITGPEKFHLPPAFSERTIKDDWVDWYKKWVLRQGNKEKKRFYIHSKLNRIEVINDRISVNNHFGNKPNKRRFPDVHKMANEKKLDVDNFRVQSYNIRIIDNYYPANTILVYASEEHKYNIVASELDEANQTSLRQEIKLNKIEIMTSTVANKLIRRVVLYVDPIKTEYLNKNGKWITLK